MIVGPTSKPIPMQLTLEPAYIDRGVRVYIRKMNNSLVQTVDISHVSLGLYMGSFTHSTEEYLILTFVVYTDNAFTTIDEFIGRTSKIYRVKNDPPSLDDLLNSPLAKINYQNRMTTVFNTTTCQHEVLVWADRDGQRVTNGADCTLVIKDSVGVVQYSDSATTPNSDGIFRFSRVFKPGVDKNYYVVISIKVDGSFRTSHQSFFTLG